jgi:hypothetical protein
MSGRGGGYGGGYGGYYGQQTKPDEIDEWGNMWKWESSTFVDDYDNTIGYGASELGYNRNPLVSRTTNTMWIFDRVRKLWIDRDDSSKTQKTYPGKPIPVKPVKVQSTSFTVSDPKWTRIAIRRIGRLRGTVGFGNARAVRILFDKARSRLAARITAAREAKQRPNIFHFERDDLLGPRADERAIESSEAWCTLLAMDGLHEVKKSLKQLLALVTQNAVREEAEKPMHAVALNRIFLGNPGTG